MFGAAAKALTNPIARVLLLLGGTALNLPVEGHRHAVVERSRRLFDLRFLRHTDPILARFPDGVTS